MNIYEKLIEVRKTVPYLKKEAKGYQFNYTSSSQVLGNLKAKMDELGLLLVPNITGKKVTPDIYEKIDNKGNPKRTVDYFTEIDVTFTWINVEKPEEQISCSWYGQGVDTAGEKGVGKALTYAEKYFMLKFFNIPTDSDDPDSFQKKVGVEVPKKETKKKEEVNWPGFWAGAKGLGLSRELVHEIAGAESINDWNREQMADLYKKLQSYAVKHQTAATAEGA